MATEAKHTPGAIVVREADDGDFTVIRGGDIYWKGEMGAVPGQIAKGETASAAEICEWQEFGVLVENASGAAS